MLEIYFKLITLRKQAHDIPYSKTLIAVWLLLDFVLLAIVAYVLNSELSQNLWLEVFDVVFTAGSLWCLLWYTKHTPRFVQTYSAVLGVNVILFAVLTLITLVMQSGQVFGFLAQPIYLWFLVVFAYILKDALETTVLKAALCVLGIEVLRLLILIEMVERFS